MERIGAGAELTFRGVIAQVLRAYREHWRSLLIFGLIVFVPLGVLDVASEHIGEPLLEEDADFDFGTIAALIATIFGLSLGLLVGEVVFTGIVSAAVADWRAGRERSVRELLAHLPIGRLICVDLLWVAVIFAGFLALIVPGVIFLVWFALVAPACELEDRGIVDSFRRSRELVRRRFRLAFAIVIMMIAAQRAADQRRGRAGDLAVRRGRGRGVDRRGAHRARRVAALGALGGDPVPRPAGLPEQGADRERVVAAQGLEDLAARSGPEASGASWRLTEKVTERRPLRVAAVNWV